ncbi:MAG: M23 family metallopeptidase [Desulfobacterota bacterium]|nr:M23 family metallopeptidase [Thermodesulfobacteriota bacterium]
MRRPHLQDRFQRDRRRFVRRLLLLGPLGTAVIALTVYLFLLPHQPIPSRQRPSEAETIEQKISPPLQPTYQVKEGALLPKGSFSDSLRRSGIPPDRVDQIVGLLKPLIDFRRLKAGHFRYTADEAGEMVAFVFEAGPIEIYEIDRGPQGYVARRKEVPLQTRLERVEGVIRSSLFEAMEAAGEKETLVLSVADILSAEIDFYKEVKEGDRFRILVEKAYKGGEFIRYGLIHAIEFHRGERVIRGIHFEGDYYNERGLSLKKAFLKSPLRFTRISSRFSRARKHPILGGLLPHYGVDYAAPEGTPVWAVADGVVVSCGWGGGFGKQVVLDHRNGYKTYYGHLSRFGPRIRKGVQVKQKEVIGYVGSTGLSTGPHLDYRLAKDGRFRNPLSEKFPLGHPIDPRKMEGFQQRRDQVLAWLNGERVEEGRRGSDGVPIKGGG